MQSAELDGFGKELMTRVRDRALQEIDGLVSGGSRAPLYAGLRDKISTLPDAERRFLFEICTLAIDQSLFEMLNYIDESQEKVEVRYRSLDDTSWLSIAQESDGLSGELYGDNGWVAKYSKYDQFSD